jgi:hypothetical protein
VTVAKERHELKLGKGSAFVKSRFKRLRQEDETWEADFRALPKPRMQSETHYLGMVVTQPHDFYLAELEVQGGPSVNDLATLLAHAMPRPFTEGAHRPSRLHVRGHRQSQALFPHLEELGIKVSVRQELPKVKEAYEDYLGQMREASRAKMVKPSAEQQTVEELFPAIAQWVLDGHLEIGDQEGFGFVVRALDYGGLVFEDDKPETLAEALAALETGLRKWFDKQGISVT